MLEDTVHERKIDWRNLVVNQIKDNKISIVLGTFVSAILFALVVFLSYWKGIPIKEFTRDPLSLSEASFYTGFVSQVGCALWIATAAICVFCAAFLRAKKSKYFLFFLFSAGISLLLGMDDMFMLHEDFFPYLGIPEKLIYVVYTLILMGFCIMFFKQIWNSNFVLFLLGLGSFALSLVLDLIPTPGLHPYLFEDGLKFFGIIMWFFYFYKTGQLALRNNSLKA